MNPLSLRVKDVVYENNPRFSLDNTLIRESFDPISNQFAAQLVLEAGKLTYDNVRVAEKKEDIKMAQLKSSVPGGPYALPIRQIETTALDGKKTLETVYIGAGAGQSENTVTYTAQGEEVALNKGAGRLIQDAALGDNQFHNRPDEYKRSEA